MNERAPVELFLRRHDVAMSPWRTVQLLAFGVLALERGMDVTCIKGPHEPRACDLQSGGAATRAVRSDVDEYLDRVAGSRKSLQKLSPDSTP